MGEGIGRAILQRMLEENQIIYICDFRRGMLNVCEKRSHPTFAPRPQI